MKLVYPNRSLNEDSFLLKLSSEDLISGVILLGFLRGLFQEDEYLMFQIIFVFIYLSILSYIRFNFRRGIILDFIDGIFFRFRVFIKEVLLR